jgi:indole-3-glycerol phosphate synthase
MVLDEILEKKKKALEEKKGKIPVETFLPQSLKKQRSLIDRLNEQFGVIAEIKRASPSAGNINRRIDVKETAILYQRAGAAGISVLTCGPYFLGNIKDLLAVRKSVDIPVLMKDFIFDRYQIYEGYYYGADVFLLIARILDEKKFRNLISLVEQIDREIILEVHSKQDIEKTLKIVKNWDNKILGINNRNLDTLQVDLNTTRDLLKFISRDKITVISESGIKNFEDIKMLRQQGVKGILVGESLLKSKNIDAKLKELKGI